jgi:hypothetical protein
LIWLVEFLMTEMDPLGRVVWLNVSFSKG